jgi:anti-sigma B factor antagonist
VSADRLVVDLLLCTFLDSAGVRVLANCMRDHAPEGKSMAVVASDPGILRVLEITGLDAMVTVHPSVEDAV